MTRTGRPLYRYSAARRRVPLGTQLVLWRDMLMTRYSRPFCTACRRTMADPGQHLSTAAHRSVVARSARARAGTLPSGRKVAVAAAHRSLNDWDGQYSEADPGNSPQWDREQRS